MTNMSVIAELSEQRQAYVKNRVKGMNKRQAALKAGYAVNTARVASSSVETPDVKAVFQDVIARAAGMDGLARTLVEGLHATKTELASFEGKFTDERTVPDYKTRTRYLEIAAEWAGYVVREDNSKSSLHVLALVPRQEQPAPAQAIDVESSITPATVPPVTT